MVCNKQLIGMAPPLLTLTISARGFRPSAPFRRLPHASFRSSAPVLVGRSRAPLPSRPPPLPQLVDVHLASSGDEPGVAYVGAERSGRGWTASLPARGRAGGKRMSLGSFASAKDASDAFVAAAAALGLDDGVGGAPAGVSKPPRKPRAAAVAAAAEAAAAESAAAAALGAPAAESFASTTGSAPPPPPLPVVKSQYLGVVREGAGATLWEAVIDAGGGVVVSGGEYEDEADAARAYDALARMYRGADAATNFPLDPYTAWVPPEDVLSVGQIATRPGQALTAEEIAAALVQERGLDVRVVPLAGRSNLADALVFATGRAPPHMRRMADTVTRALRKRALPGVDATAEGRDADDWIVVDCGNVIVNIMDAEAREVFALEAFYENMRIGEDPYAGMSYDEWLAANPIPDKWLARLERDEREMEAKQRAGRSGGGGAQQGAALAAASPGAEEATLRRRTGSSKVKVRRDREGAEGGGR